LAMGMEMDTRRRKKNVVEEWCCSRRPKEEGRGAFRPVVESCGVAGKLPLLPAISVCVCVYVSHENA
jgi:hypothetical protein